MAIYHFRLPWPVIDTVTHELVKDRADGILLDLDGNRVTATTPLGLPTPITTGRFGTTGHFDAPIEAGVVRFGSAEAAVYSNETFVGGAKAAEALAAAQEAKASVDAAAANATTVSYVRRDPDGTIWFTDYPITDGSGGHPHIRSDGTAYIRFP